MIPEVSDEIDPFVKRVVTIKPEDDALVIFKYLGSLTREMVDDLTVKLEKKMGEIPFVVIDEHFDITVLKRPTNNGGAFIA